MVHVNYGSQFHKIYEYLLFAGHCASQYGYRNEQGVSARLYGFSYKCNKNKIHKCSLLVAWVELRVGSLKKKKWGGFWQIYATCIC